MQAKGTKDGSINNRGCRVMTTCDATHPFRTRATLNKRKHHPLSCPWDLALTVIFLGPHLFLLQHVFALLVYLAGDGRLDIVPAHDLAAASAEQILDNVHARSHLHRECRGPLDVERFSKKTGIAEAAAESLVLRVETKC